MRTGMKRRAGLLGLFALAAFGLSAVVMTAIGPLSAGEQATAATVACYPEPLWARLSIGPDGQAFYPKRPERAVIWPAGYRVVIRDGQGVVVDPGDLVVARIADPLPFCDQMGKDLLFKPDYLPHASGAISSSSPDERIPVTM